MQPCLVSLASYLAIMEFVLVFFLSGEVDARGVVSAASSSYVPQYLLKLSVSSEGK